MGLRANIARGFVGLKIFEVFGGESLVSRSFGVRQGLRHGRVFPESLCSDGGMRGSKFDSDGV